MNNKGFAISSIIYGILIIFLLFIFSTLSLLVTRGDTLSKIKHNALSVLKGKNDTIINMDALVADFKTINITNDATDYVTINYNINVYSPYNYRIENVINGNKITYTAYNGTEVQMTVDRSINNNANSKIVTYEYTKHEEKILIEPGLHKIEVWGASGSAGKGGYASGFLYLNQPTIAYINIGGEKKTSINSYNDSVTHIALKSGLYSTFENKSNVIIAAGGNGGEGYNNYSELINKTTYTSTCIDDNPTSNCTKNGDGYIKITSLIYYSK